MYSQLKSIQILVALLKKHGVRHVVISPGGSSRNLTRSIESDSYFKCYSVVDERSAAFFGLGMAQSLGEPTAILCTSGTAVCNYMSGVEEAFYQSVPLVVITADRHPYLLNQLETQKLDQVGIFDNVCKKSVTLPEVRDDDDFWYCQRLVNEALLELDHHGRGPVHINIPTFGFSQPSACVVEELPEVVAMQRILPDSEAEIWRGKADELSSCKRILVVCGQSRPYAAEEIQQMESFFEKFNCVLSVEHLSNLSCEGTLVTYPVTETVSSTGFKELLPDIVISLGDNFVAGGLKSRLRQNRGQFEHWLIDEKGLVKDVFKGLSTIFECTPFYFFRMMNDHAPKQAKSDCVYFREWGLARERVEVPDFPFSNICVAKKFAKMIPAGSLLHLSILNSTRHMQFFSLPADVEVSSNIGALGIDGSMSTLIGQATATDRLCFLLIGDLSFFYDMNSLLIRHMGNNVRILLVNNCGGGEFHFSAGGPTKYPNVEEFIAVRHERSAKGWIESLGFDYLTASDEKGFEEALDAFVQPSDRPIVLEAFTDMAKDGEIVRQFYAANSQKSGQDRKKEMLKGVGKKVLGEKFAQRTKNAYKAIRGD